MNKIKLMWVTCLTFITLNKSYCQQKINFEDIKFDISKFIFYGTPSLTKCNEKGSPLGAADEFTILTAEMHSTFYIHRKLNESTYVIRFIPYSTKKGLFESKDTHEKNLNKAERFNYLTPPNTTNSIAAKKKESQKSSIVRNLVDDAFFIISLQDLKDYAYQYNPVQKYDFSIGTISYLARMRPEVKGVASRWSTDLSLGVAAGIRRNYGENAGLSLLMGIAVTKISLDATSTGGVVTGSTEKPALTPNLNLLFTYKIFSVGVGVGLDWINEDSPETKAWIYNKRAFYAVGFGINIFSQSTGKTAKQDQ